jgi:hypothetical protein
MTASCSVHDADTPTVGFVYLAQVGMQHEGLGSVHRLGYKAEYTHLRGHGLALPSSCLQQAARGSHAETRGCVLFKCPAHRGTAASVIQCD